MMRLVKPARVQAHRVYGGTDYGPRQLLLVDAPDARLMWVPPHTSYTGRMSGSVYVKGTLWLVRDDFSIANRIVMQHVPGTRLTTKVLHSDPVQAAVAAMWGRFVAEALDVDATLVLSAQDAAQTQRQSPVGVGG